MKALLSNGSESSHRRRVVLRIVLGAAALTLVCAAWVGWRTYQAYSHLQTAATAMSNVQSQLRDIASSDEPASTIASVVGNLQQDAAQARSAVDDPIFRAATRLPWIGQSLAAIGQVAHTVDALATDALPALVSAVTTLRPADMAPRNGTIDLLPIEAIAPALETAAATVRSVQADIASIDRSSIAAPVADAVGSLSLQLDQATAVTDAAATIGRLLPQMLGSQGQRRYLVLFQNSAEPRSTGGIFGSFALVTADRGKITIVDQGSAARALLIFDPPAVELTETQTLLYGQNMARYSQDANATPDFPSAASIFVSMYQQRGGGAIDGVLAIDPVALSYMLKGAAPLDVGPGMTITSKNLVPMLLSTAYQAFPKGDQLARDDFLAHATGVVFSSLMSGTADPRSILTGLTQAIEERRILLYSTDPTVQAGIATSPVSGAITPDVAAPSLGVFLNDRTGAKLGFYLHNEVHVTAGECRTDGRREWLVRVVLHGRAPVAGLPSYVLGVTPVGKAYRIRTDILLYAPTGGAVVDVATSDGTALPMVNGVDLGRQVGVTTVEMSAADSVGVNFSVLGPITDPGDTADVPPTLILTPGVRQWDSSVETYQKCGKPPG